MNRHCGIQRLPALPGEHHDDGTLVGFPALDQASLLHPSELVREAALVPAHALGQSVLAHLAFAKAGKTREDSKLGPGQRSLSDEVAPDPAQYVFAHRSKGVPDAKFPGRQ